MLVRVDDVRADVTVLFSVEKKRTGDGCTAVSSSAGLPPGAVQSKRISYPVACIPMGSISFAMTGRVWAAKCVARRDALGLLDVLVAFTIKRWSWGTIYFPSNQSNDGNGCYDNFERQLRTGTLLLSCLLPTMCRVAARVTMETRRNKTMDT